MGGGFATVAEDDGVRFRSADVNGFTVTELLFPPQYRQAAFEPELPYIAVVLEGGMLKTFRRRTMDFDGACALIMPAGAAHSARFGANGARVVAVRAKDPSGSIAAVLDRLADLRGPGFTRLGWCLAAELRASDAAASLAVEGFALELLAATSRGSAPARPVGRTPAWLSSAEELLRARIDDRIGLRELADAVAVNPSHLARTFRARYGVSVGEYGRRLRLEWAATEIARSDTPLAQIASQGGFADQSHFTRLFKQHVGTTPARYREETHVPK